MIRQENPNPIGYKSMIDAIKPVMFVEKSSKVPTSEAWSNKSEVPPPWKMEQIFYISVKNLFIYD